MTTPKTLSGYEAWIWMCENPGKKLYHDSQQRGSYITRYSDGRVMSFNYWEDIELPLVSMTWIETSFNFYPEQPAPKPNPMPELQRGDVIGFQPYNDFEFRYGFVCIPSVWSSHDIHEIHRRIDGQLKLIWKERE